MINLTPKSCDFTHRHRLIESHTLDEHPKVLFPVDEIEIRPDLDDAHDLLLGQAKKVRFEDLLERINVQLQQAVVVHDGLEVVRQVQIHFVGALDGLRS